jgi:hypothetical protein
VHAEETTFNAPAAQKYFVANESVNNYSAAFRIFALAEKVVITQNGDTF